MKKGEFTKNNYDTYSLKAVEKFSKPLLQDKFVSSILYEDYVIIRRGSFRKKPIRVHKEFDFNVYEFEPMPLERLKNPLQKVA